MKSATGSEEFPPFPQSSAPSTLRWPVLASYGAVGRSAFHNLATCLPGLGISGHKRSPDPLQKAGTLVKSWIILIYPLIGIWNTFDSIIYRIW